MIKLGVARRLTAIIANVSLLFNSFVPFLLAAQPVYAQEAPAVEEIIVESTPTPEPSIIEISPEPTVEPIPELLPEITPIIEITPTPENTPIPEPTPSIDPVNVEIGVLVPPVGEITPTPEPSVEPTPTPENIITPEPSPVATPIFEKICLTDEQIKDTANEDWVIDDVNGISETKGKVQLGVRYVYPQENKVSVTFKCLPKDESLRTNLKIQKVKTADLALPDTMGSVSEYAYDITTGMTDGDFEYDVTLPKPADSTAEISYIEKSVDEAKSNLTFFDINKINSNVEQQSDIVKATGINHFTIFIITADSTVNENSVDNQDRGWVSDNSYATFDNDNDWAEYGFPNHTIPVGSIINGIEILVEGYASSSRDFLISLWNTSNNPDDYTNTKIADLSNIDGIKTLGSPTDLWGKTWTSSDFNDSVFKIRIDADNDSGNAYLDHVELKVYYSNPIPNPPTLNCSNDAQGANDEPNQKDLTKMCVSPHLPTFVETWWNWDDTAWSGGNTGSACNLFDTDGDGNANYSLCVFVGGNPASFQSRTLYSCGDDRADRCTSPTAVAPTTAECGAKVLNDDPFNSSNDTVGYCKTNLSELGSASTVNLIDVCSYPSEQPNSDPSDCIFYEKATGKLEVKKVLSPTSDSGKFNLQIDDVTSGTGANVGNNGTTGEIIVDADSHTVKETAGLSTNLNNYTSSIECKDLNGTGTIVASIANSGPLSVSVEDGDDIVCTITNTKKAFCGNNVVEGNEQCDGTAGVPSGYSCSGTCTLIRNTGTITVDKITNPSGDQTSFPFTVISTETNTNESFNLSDQSTPWSMTLPTGVYTVSEGTLPTGWSLSNVSCISDQGTPITRTFDLDNGENVTCTFTNSINRGSLTIIKDSLPNDPQDFSFTTSGIGLTNFSLDDDSNATLSNTKLFPNLLPGTYSVSEGNVAGWDKTSATCSDGSTINSINIGPGENVTCTFVNTKRGSLKIIKDSQPDDTQNFIFKLKDSNNVQIGSTELDDDNVANSRLNNHTFTNLIPASYKVYEDSVTGWTLDNVNCTNTSGRWDFDNGHLIVEVKPGEQPICTFINTKDTGTITITKDSIPDDGQNFYFDANPNFPDGDFELDDNNSGPTPNTKTFTVPIGGYTVTEGTVEGWKLTNLVCTGDSNGSVDLINRKATINLDKGENVVCTYTNTKLASITLKKETNPDSNSSLTFNYTGSLGNHSFYDEDTDTYNNLLPGSYTITESEKTGWYLKDIVCSGSGSVSSNISNRSVTISLKAGESTTCEFVNNKKGQIKGEKFYDKNGNNQDDSGEPDLKDWKIFIDENNNGQYDAGERFDLTDHDGDYSFDNLLPDTYRVCEEMQTGWYPVSGSNCKTTTIHNDGGDVDEINFANRQFGSINVCKVITNGDGDIVNGSEVLGSNFTIDWDKDLADSVFSAGYEPNTKIFASSEGNDAYCRLYENLLIDTYHYSTESISGNTSIWELPKYNDQYESSVDNIDDFYDYNQNTDSNGEINLALDAGINRTLVILNQYKNGSVNVTKFNDINGNGKYDDSEKVLSGWDINLSDATKTTGENGQVLFDGLNPDTYYLSENIKNGWKQTNIYCEDDSEGVLITAPKEAYGHHGNCEGWNGCKDAATCALWACEVKGYSQLVSYGEQLPCTEFDNCHLFYSRGNIDWDWGRSCPVMGVTDIRCSGPGSTPTPTPQMSVFNRVFGVQAVNAQEAPEEKGYKINLSAGENVKCYIGNQLISPKATIAKSNNVSSDLSPGDSVEYKIKLNILDNDVTGFKVTDLLSNGFKYRVGSYKVTKNGLPYSILEPEYHSPGVWNLGDLKAGDKLELIYIADINTDQQSGKYADLAWASGQAAYEEKLILATAEDEGYIANNFVGTKVPVNKNPQNSYSADIETEIGGDVLGATTELPGTGAATIWLIISGFLGIAGFSLLKISKKTMLTILLTILSFAFILNPVKAVDSNLVVRVEEPRSPSSIKDLDLKFVALDILGRPITVQCFKKGPTDSDFSQFGSDIALTDGGNSSHCSLMPVINDNGSYQFKVVALAGAQSASQIVNLDYKTSSPDTPSDYRKEEVNDCDYKIHFKTANDNGKTVKVELYRSEDTSFDLNSGTLVSEISIGSNQEHDITNHVPDCSKNYYYVIRAFDDAGNGSGITGDSVVKTTSGSTTTTTGSVSGAIPLIGDDNIPKEGTETDQDGASTENQEGSILGSETPTNPKSISTQFQSFISRHKFSSALIAVLILVIIGYVVKKIGKKKR